MTDQTYWNGEPTPCRRVVVRVGKATKPSFWHNGLEGTERRAVEIQYGADTYLIDDDEGEGQPVYDERQTAMLAQRPPQREFRAGDGWLKVTVGEGAPFGPHSRSRSLPDDSVILREATP
jgi:hypothetical protein